MSRFLKFILIGACAWMIIFFLCLKAQKWLFAIVLFILGCCFAINFVLYAKLKKNVNQMNANGTVRNVDYLIIGENFDSSRLVDASSSKFQILSPGRSLYVSKEILRHTFSILKEGGTVIILDKGNKNQKFTCFDTLWLHDITIKRLGLKVERKLNKFPLFLSPIKSICILFNIRNMQSGTPVEMKCPDESIAEFCFKRGLNFKYYLLRK